MGHRRERLRCASVATASPRWTVDRHRRSRRTVLPDIMSPTPAWSAAHGAAAASLPDRRRRRAGAPAVPPPLRHRDRHDHHRRLDDRHHRARRSSARPAQTLQDILAREPGIQVTQPVRQRERRAQPVDMRGFGAAGTSNTLVLINGRRLNDIDMAGVDFASIPREQHRADRDHPRQ